MKESYERSYNKIMKKMLRQKLLSFKKKKITCYGLQIISPFAKFLNILFGRCVVLCVNWDGVKNVYGTLIAHVRLTLARIYYDSRAVD